MAKKSIAIVLMIVGAALLIGVGLFALDIATSAEPEGLGTWIFTVLGLLLGASTGIKGWLDWNKKEVPSQVTNTTASDDAQIATGEYGRNVKQGNNSQYIENFHEAPKIGGGFSTI
ncbi:MAG TPA: phage holin family protein, partial [Anaerolineales bacterium]|nr:phage holin family protein [Anaerolineales bacterium]